jgi:hypothetical protein
VLRQLQCHASGPALVLRSPREELELLGAFIHERPDVGSDPGDIGVLVEVGCTGEDVVGALARAKIAT